MVPAPPAREGGFYPISSQQKKGSGLRLKGAKQGKKKSKKVSTSKSLLAPAIDKLRLDMQRMMTRAPQRKSPRPKADMRMTPSLFSHCAAKYAIAVADPMNPEAAGACVPTGNSRPSFKVRTVQRGSFVVGTGGAGWIIYIPTLAKNTYMAFTTNVAYTGSGDNLYVFAGSSAVTGLGVGVDNVFNPTAPFTDSQLFNANAELGVSTNVVGRIVSAGLSAQYAGTVMDMGGTMSTLSRATHQTALAGGGTSIPSISVSNVQSFTETRMARVSDQKVWIIDSARLDGEENYSGNTIYQQDVSEGIDQGNILYPFSQGSLCTVAVAGSLGGLANTGVVANIILVTGAKPGAIFNYEIVQHMEFQGSGAQFGLSPSHQDAVGFAKVREAASAIPALAVEYPQASYPSLMKHAIDMASEHLAPRALAAGGAMLQKALAGGGLAASLGAGASMLIA